VTPLYLMQARIARAGYPVCDGGTVGAEPWRPSLNGYLDVSVSGAIAETVIPFHPGHDVRDQIVGSKSQPFEPALPARDLHALSHWFVYVRAGRAGRSGFNKQYA
jgi:hypothetical protein